MPNLSKAARAATPERKKKAHRTKSVEVPNKVDASAVRSSLDIDMAERRRRSTIGIYSLKAKDGGFGIPFCAANDNFALLAQKQILPLSDCYKVGEFCLFDGRCRSLLPSVILDK